MCRANATAALDRSAGDEHVIQIDLTDDGRALLTVRAVVDMDVATSVMRQCKVLLPLKRDADAELWRLILSPPSEFSPVLPLLEVKRLL
jgi:hypothetical protein